MAAGLPQGRASLSDLRSNRSTQDKAAASDEACFAFVYSPFTILETINAFEGHLGVCGQDIVTHNVLYSQGIRQTL